MSEKPARNFSPISFRPSYEQMERMIFFQAAFQQKHGIRPGLTQILRTALDEYLDSKGPDVGLPAKPKKKSK